MGLTTFADIVGQENALRELRSELAANRLNHAYLLEGGAGTGKLTLARALAARYLCHRPEGGDACGQCRSCRMLAEGNHPDYLELPREGRALKIERFVRRSGEGEGTEQEPVLEFMRYKPLLEHGRVCVVPRAERMDEAAANAFLKTLEEPPPGSLFILTAAARERLIGTVVSRCRRVIVAPLSAAAIAAALARPRHDADAGAEEGDAGEAPAPLGEKEREVVAQMAAGSLGAAWRLAAGGTLEDWKALDASWRDFTPAAAAAWAESVLQELADLKTADEKRARVLYWLDMAALKVRRLARRGAVSALGAAGALERLWKAGERLEANVRPELVTLTAALGAFAALRGTESDGGAG